MSQQPQKRLVQPQELGALAAFLCRDEALAITMEDIQVNGGNWW
ncbi:MAG: SDR family oxidoreductase [Pseudomonadota bacterium]